MPRGAVDFSGRRAASHRFLTVGLRMGNPGFFTFHAGSTCRGFKSEGACVHIITFRFATLEIADKIKPLYLTPYAYYLTSKTTRVVQLFSHSRTGTITGTYFSLSGVTIQNLSKCGFFQFVWWRAREQYFNNRDHCLKPTLRSDMDPNVPERLLRP